MILAYECMQKEETMKHKNTLLYQTITPLHMGADNVLGLVDLPIQREKHTNLPKMEASGIKGVYRSKFCEEDQNITCEQIQKWFGAASENNDDSEMGNAGNIIFYDARILFFPVVSSSNLFVWITCPFVLNRFKEETEYLTYDFHKLRFSKDGYTIYSLDKAKQDNKTMNLANYTYTIKNLEVNPINALFSHLSQPLKDKLKGKIYIVDDATFSYFCEMNTEIHTRIRIGENGVVEKGALFTEEYIPDQCFFYQNIDFMKADEVGEDAFFKAIEDASYMQFGGNASLGKGITKVYVMDDVCLKQAGDKL